MRFEIGVALKYFIPRWRQLSVSLISLISIGVISLVVWLVIVFLSVTDGLENKWVTQLIATNAPLKVVPTQQYFDSYYYLVDGYSLQTGYQFKSLGEKIQASTTDPYDPSVDFELPGCFPAREENEAGAPLDLAGNCYKALEQVGLDEPGVFFDEFEVGYANLQMNLVRQHQGVIKDSIVSQVSYVMSQSPKNRGFLNYFCPIRQEDYEHLHQTIVENETLSDIELQKEIASLIGMLDIQSFKTSESGLLLPQTMYPEKGTWECCLIHDDKNTIVIVPQSSNADLLLGLRDRLLENGYNPALATLFFEGNQPFLFSRNYQSREVGQIWLDQDISFEVEDVKYSSQDVLGHLKTNIQGIKIQGLLSTSLLVAENATPKIELTNKELSPYWLHVQKEVGCLIPHHTTLGHGILVSKNFQKSGALIGDKGTLSFLTHTSTVPAEQKVPVYIAGFFDPGCMPMASKMIFTSPEVVGMLRGNLMIPDQMANNGFQVWVKNLKQTPKVKGLIQQRLQEAGLDRYFAVESYEDYEFSKPILQQLKSDKYIFSLIAVIILVVACSSIISMLILLVNDKRKEIGVLCALGASKKAVQLIFGFCGVLAGLISSCIGIVAAFITLKNLDSIIRLLSLIQGRDVLQPMLFGSSLPDFINVRILVFTMVITSFLSLIAGLIPAIKASKIKPSEILKSE